MCLSKTINIRVHYVNGFKKMLFIFPHNINHNPELSSNAISNRLGKFVTVAGFCTNIK